MACSASVTHVPAKKEEHWWDFATETDTLGSLVQGKVCTFGQARWDTRRAGSTLLPKPPLKPQYSVYYLHFELFPEKSFFQML